MIVVWFSVQTLVKFRNRPAIRILGLGDRSGLADKAKHADRTDLLGLT